MHFRLDASDSDFPTALRHANPPAKQLFGVGNSELLRHPDHCRGLAIVGSRQATPQGLADARWFAREISQAGLTIVSGLAQGIDASAHRGALDVRGRTIAVLGHGRDRIYPPHHGGLAECILSSAGALVTEYPDGTPPRPFHFPNRNRIIAGLARAVLVVEAAPLSGSMSTARHALDLGIDVFVIPGSIHQPQSQGCNGLIRQGAQPVQSPHELLDDLGLAPRLTRTASLASHPVGRSGRSVEGRQPGLAIELDADTNRVLNELSFQAVAISELLSRTGLDQERLYGCLLILELSSLVNRTPDGRWHKYRPKQ